MPGAELSLAFAAPVAASGSAASLRGAAPPAAARAKAVPLSGGYQRSAGGGNLAVSASLSDTPVLEVLREAESAIDQLRHSEGERAKLSQELEVLRVRIQDAPDGEFRCFKCSITNWVDRSVCKHCGELRADMAFLRKVQGMKAREKRSLQEGRGGGFFDRQSADKKEWNSDDEELDEFGRKKKRRKRAA